MLTGLFDRVGLRTNVQKTVGMVCRPCQAAGVRSNKSYTWRMIGEGRSFKERQRERVICPKCRKDMEKGSMVTYRQTHHGMAKGGLGSEGVGAYGSNGVNKTIIHRMVFTTRVEPSTCPVKGCSGQALLRTVMRVHFWHRHVRNTVVILDEVNLPHPKCPQYDILVPWKSLNGTHICTPYFTLGAEQKRRRLAAEEEREVTARAFSAYGCPLEMVTSFRYLGRVILEADEDWPEVVTKSYRARAFWRRMTRIFSREEAAPQVSGIFFKAVVQAVLLFGLETWVVVPQMGKSLRGFQDQVERPLTGRLPWRTLDEKWTHNLVVTAREEVGFLAMEEYIR